MPINFGNIQTTRGREYRTDNIAKIDSALAYLPMQQRASIIGSIIEESGGDPFAKDETGAYQGLLQWGADRYQIQSDDPNVELNNQIQYIKETLNDTTDHKSWTDGGKGSGYKSFRDTYGSFTNPASDLDDVFRAFNFGYVRPQGKQDSFENRLKVVKQVYDRMKGDYSLILTGHTEQPDATRVARPVLPVHMKGEGGPLDSPRQWDNLSLSEKSDIMREAVANGITSLREIGQAYNEYAEGGIMDEPEGTVAENQESAEAAKYNDGGHLFNGGGYKPSASIMRDIANWEGSSMETNRSFEAEARDFNRVIPRSVMSRLSQEQLDALYSYGYNVGMGNLKKRVLPTLTAYTQGRAGAEDVASSMWASRDKDLLGLRRRRAWERDMFTNQMSGRDLRSYRTSNALLSASIDEGIRKLNEAINAGSAYQDYTLPYPVPAPFNPTVYDDAWTVLGQDEPQQEVAEPVIVEEKRDPLALMQFVEEMTTPQAPSPLADYKPQATGYEGSGQGMYVPSFAPSHASMLDDSWFAEGGHLFDGTGESWMDTGIIRDVPISEISINPETGYLTTPYSDYGVRVLPQVNVTTQAGGYGLKADKDNYYNTSADNYPRLVGDKVGDDINKVVLGSMALGTAPITLPEMAAIVANTEGVQAISSAASGDWVPLASWTPRASFELAGGLAGGNIVNNRSKAINGKTWGENVSEAIDYYTGAKIPSSITEMTNPGYLLGGYAASDIYNSAERRLIETFMRTTPTENPIPEVVQNWKNMPLTRKAAIANYVLTGYRGKLRPFGYANSFAEESFLGTIPYYTGFTLCGSKSGGPSDMIDAYLYGREIDPVFGLKKINNGDFGIHDSYVRTNYPHKAKDIPIYEQPLPPEEIAGFPPKDNNFFETGTVSSMRYDRSKMPFGPVNTAGHRVQYGKTLSGEPVKREQDIWKFKRDEYISSWRYGLDLGSKMLNNEKNSRKLDFLYNFGLNEVDRFGTPIITRTPWYRTSSFDYDNSFLKKDL